MKQHYSGTQNVTSIATFTARREAKFSPIRVGGYINQDVRFMKPGDSILIRLRTGGYTIGSIGLIEGEGDDAKLTIAFPAGTKTLLARYVTELVAT